VKAFLIFGQITAALQQRYSIVNCSFHPQPHTDQDWQLRELDLSVDQTRQGVDALHWPLANCFRPPKKVLDLCMMRLRKRRWPSLDEFG
jgi:hypothetical protein